MRAIRALSCDVHESSLHPSSLYGHLLLNRDPLLLSVCVYLYQWFFPFPSRLFTVNPHIISHCSVIGMFYQLSRPQSSTDHPLNNAIPILDLHFSYLSPCKSPSRLSPTGMCLRLDWMSSCSVLHLSFVSFGSAILLRAFSSTYAPIS